MSKTNLSSKLVYMVLLFVCMSVVGALIINPAPSSPTHDHQVAQVTNKTQSLEVVKTEVADNAVRLSLRNNAKKNVNWFKLSFGGYSAQVDFMFAYRSILAPGEVFEEVFTIQPGSEIKVAVLAVVFDDGTSEGDSGLVNEIKLKRLGQKQELTRLLPLLQDALNSTNADTPSAIDSLKKKIIAFRQEQEDTLTEDVLIGRRNIRERILAELQKVERQQQEQKGLGREEMSKLKADYEKIKGKL